ncbi:MAG: hypothetical protein ACTSPY_00295 [Candidatus Helarchaeota archaeon]
MSDVDKSDIMETFHELELIISRNIFLITDYIKDLIGLLKKDDYRLYVVDILEDISMKNPELFENSIKLLLDNLKIHDLQLDILSILENILEKDPNIFIDEIIHIKNAVNEPFNNKIKQDLYKIYVELKNKFPDMILDPIDSLIKEIEDQDINIINIYDNLFTNYREIIEKNIDDDFDPLKLLLSFSENKTEIFKDSINYLINSLENEMVQLYTIDILKNISKKMPIYFEGYIHQLISYLDMELFQFDIVEILEYLTQIPRLFQSEIPFLISQLNNKYIKLDIIRILREISEVNPTFFKNEIGNLIQFLNDNNISFKLNIWGILRNISYDAPEIIKNNIIDFINLLENEVLRLESIDILKNLGRKNPTLFKDNILDLIQYLNIKELKGDILDILLNISIRDPKLLFNYESEIFNLLKSSEIQDEVIKIFTNIIQFVPRTFIEKIPIYLNNLDIKIILDKLYPEIRTILIQNKFVINNNLKIFNKLIINGYATIEFKDTLNIIKSKLENYKVLGRIIKNIDDKFATIDEIFLKLDQNQIVPAKYVIILLDYIFNLKNFSLILKEYIDKEYLFDQKENRVSFYEILKTIEHGLNKMTNKIKKYASKS